MTFPLLVVFAAFLVHGAGAALMLRLMRPETDRYERGDEIVATAVIGAFWEPVLLLGLLAFAGEIAIHWGRALARRFLPRVRVDWGDGPRE